MPAGSTTSWPLPRRSCCSTSTGCATPHSSICRRGWQRGTFNGFLLGWWKLDAARALASEEPGRWIVWNDDVVEWLDANPHVHVVAPDLFTGLTHQHLEEIEAWL